MVVNLSYSSIPLQKISQKGVDRSVENPQKGAENIKMAPNAPNKRESLHHGRRVGEEEKVKIRVVSGETNSLPHIETYQL